MGNESAIEAVKGGADGSGDCALHVTTEAGEHGGATVYLSNVPACALNASEFVGLRMKLKGTSKGTQDACGPLENTVHVKLSTLSTAPVEVGGNCVPPDDPSAPGCFDDFGGHCRLDEDFTTCELWFNELVQGGWGIPATFDPSEILSLAWLVEKTYDASELGGDFWIDDVEFIEAGDPATPSGSGNDCSGGAGAGGSGSAGDGSSGGSSAGATSSSGGTGERRHERERRHEFGRRERERRNGTSRRHGGLRAEAAPAEFAVFERRRVRLSSGRARGGLRGSALVFGLMALGLVARKRAVKA